MEAPESSPAPRGDDVGAWLAEHAQRHGFELDAAQRQALPHFRRLHDELLAAERGGVLSWLTPRKPVAGLYLWGGVGRGKSFLMDSYFACAPPSKKQRIHFHRFMQRIHYELKSLQGERDPLRRVAAQIAGEARLLCLDELHVSDIADAMIMRRLLEGLFEQGTVLIVTSNQHPDELYRNGLQRGQFEPAIELLKRNLALAHINGAQDYRLRAFEQAGVYHVGAEAEARLQQAFLAIARHAGAGSLHWQVGGRELPVKRHAPGVVWFEFAELCGGPRGQADYIELARRCHTVLLSGVPRFDAENAEALRRFVWLVDEFYDRRVKLMLGAAAPAAELFAAIRLDDVERTASRLAEMQSAHYLGEPHLP